APEPPRVDPEALGSALLAYAERHGAPGPVLESARALASGRARAVLTGQQPGLFGGPLYTVHKAATAVRLARELASRPGAGPVVPVFWNHSDDHDFEEANRAFLVNPNQDVQRLRLEVEGRGRAIRAVPVGAGVEHALAAVADFLPASEFRDAALEL